MAPTSLESNTLEARAHFFAKARTFFQLRNVLEVDTPALSLAPSIDAHIDPMQIRGTNAYLFTSPEYGMKRLLAEHARDIYQISHVFRDNESGRLHSPEFTMVEWYRCNVTLNSLIEETLDFVRLFLGSLPATSLTYRKALLKWAHIDCISVRTQDLRKLAHTTSAKTWDKQTLLQLLFSSLVEPHLQDLTVITDFPTDQAALARLKNEHFAERFEIYCKGIELANGFHELADTQEQRRRLLCENEKRTALGKSTLPLDESFLTSLEKGLPDCCGVAVGFDRLLMLHLGHDTLASVLTNYS